MKGKAARIIEKVFDKAGFLTVGTREFRRVEKESKFKIYEVTNPNKNKYIGLYCKFTPIRFTVDTQKTEDMKTWGERFIDDASISDGDLSVLVVTHRITESDKPNEPQFIKLKAGVEVNITFESNLDSLRFLQTHRPMGIANMDLTV
jgi:hypothetical protein